MIEVRFLRLAFQRWQWLCAALLVLLCFSSLCPSIGMAEEATVIGDSPLDTIMKTKLHPDVPEAKDFVRKSRPASDSLDYTPLTGADPVRPRIKNKTEIQALETELDRAAAQNRAKAGLKEKGEKISSPRKARGKRL